MQSWKNFFLNLYRNRYLFFINDTFLFYYVKKNQIKKISYFFNIVNKNINI